MAGYNEIGHFAGDDLTLNSAGGLALVDGIERARQRVLRRLMTVPGSYIFHPEYGAGLPEFIGKVLNVAEVTAVIRSQMRLEESVAQKPEPTILVRPILDGVAVEIQFQDAQTNAPVVLSFSVNP